MAESSKPKSGSGCLGKLAVLILLASAGGLAAAAYFMAQPQDLSDIGGRNPTVKATSARDLEVVLQSSIDRGFALTLTETEINQWLGRSLSVKQGGLLADYVTLEGVWVRLLDGHAEVVMERKIMGHPFTVSMFLTITQMQGGKDFTTDIQLHGGPYHENITHPPRGGRFGQLVVPQGFLHLVMPAYTKIPDLFPNEIYLALQKMARIRIEKNRLVLDPREPSTDPMGLPETF